MTSPWRYEVKLRRYRNTRTGRFVGPQQMRELRDTFTRAMYDDATGLIDRLATKQVKLNAALAEARGIVRAVQIDNYVMARGGRKRMTSTDWGRLGALIKSEYGYLQNFFKDIQDGKVSQAGAVHRMRMYVDAGREAYNLGERVAAKEAGLREERNVLSNAEHCAGCIAETQRGWVAIGKLKPLGTRDCRRNDRCDIEYR